MALSWQQAVLPLVPTLTAAPLAESSTSIYVISVPPSQHFHSIFCVCASAISPGVASGHTECLACQESINALYKSTQAAITKYLRWNVLNN